MISSLSVGHSTPYEKFVMNKHLEAQKEIEISFLKKKRLFLEENGGILQTTLYKSGGSPR